MSLGHRVEHLLCQERSLLGWWVSLARPAPSLSCMPGLLSQGAGTESPGSGSQARGCITGRALCLGGGVGSEGPHGQAASFVVPGSSARHHYPECRSRVGVQGRTPSKPSRAQKKRSVGACSLVRLDEHVGGSPPCPPQLMSWELPAPTLHRWGMVEGQDGTSPEQKVWGGRRGPGGERGSPTLTTRTPWWAPRLSTSRSGPSQWQIQARKSVPFFSCRSFH